VVCDDKGRPLLLHLAEGQANDHKTAAAILDQLPPARFLLADRAYSSAAFRQALTDRGVTPCIPPHAKHRVQHHYDPILYKQRHRIENLFARLKDGDGSTPATTDAPTPSCRPSPSPQPSSSGSMSPDPSER
jgi:transposase